MRFFWKALLIAIPLGGYLLYKKSKRPSETGVQSEQTKENKTTPQSPPGRSAEERDRMDPTVQIIERLTKLDGVTSRVAENLVEKGIYTREDLTTLSEEELLEIKGIGPKRAAKILNLR
jgi:ERCC4-type nuclease